MRGGRKERRARRARAKGMGKTWVGDPARVTKKNGSAMLKANPNSTRTAIKRVRADAAQAARAYADRKSGYGEPDVHQRRGW